MTESQPKPLPPETPEPLRLEDVVTPIFDLAMGQRLAIIRMKNGWDQKQLAEKLGLSSNTVSELEGGKLAVPRFAFSVTRMKEILGDLETKYILLNQYVSRFDAGTIRMNFWRESYRNRARPKGEHWTKARLQSGRPTQGYSFMGIPGEVWDLAWKLKKQQGVQPIKKVKRNGGKTG